MKTETKKALAVVGVIGGLAAIAGVIAIVQSVSAAKPGGTSKFKIGDKISAFGDVYQITDIDYVNMNYICKQLSPIQSSYVVIDMASADSQYTLV